MLRSCLAIVVVLVAHFTLTSAIFSRNSAPELPPEARLQSKAQAIVDQYLGLGRGTAIVTLRTGQGMRRSEQTLLGDKGFVVTSQTKCETYKTYDNRATSEKLELPREVITTTCSDWTEKISVAVVGHGADEELAALIQAGLALDPRRGDQVVVKVPKS